MDTHRITSGIFVRIALLTVATLLIAGCDKPVHEARGTTDVPAVARIPATA